MLVMLNEKRLYSTLYGLEGNKELLTARKKMRQGREIVVSEGHPVDMHLMIPIAKLPTLRITTTSVTLDEFREIQAAKSQRRQSNMALPIQTHVTVALPMLEESKRRPRRISHRPRHSHEEESDF